MNEKGLSKVKVITVLAITSIWIFIAIPMLCQYHIEANEAQALTQIQKLTEACEKFKIQYGKYPNDLGVLTKFVKESLTSPGYHYEYEALNEDSFVLVALPNNPLTGNNGYYGDDGNTIITVPNATTAPGAGHSIPGIMDNMIRRHKAAKALQKEKLKEKIEKEAVLKQTTVPSLQPAVQPTIPPPELVVKKEDIGNVEEKKEPPTLPVIKDNSPPLPKPEPIIISSTRSPRPKLTPPGSFENLVYSLEGVSSAPVRSITLAKEDTEVSKSLVEKSIQDDPASLVSQTKSIVSANNTTIIIEKPQPRNDIFTDTEGSARKEGKSRGR